MIGLLWTDLIAALPEETTLHPPALDAAIDECQRLLSQQLPDELAAPPPS